MKAVNLFAGIGAFTEGIRKSKIITVEAIDINPEAASIFNLNHGTGVCVARSIDGWLPNCIHFDLMYGCTPTEGWHNPSDQRRFLNCSFLRVVRETRPQFFVLGNVKSMLKDSIYHHLIKDFEYQGYITLSPWVMNAADYGVPQDREYVFIVGHLPNAVAPIMPTPLPLIEQKTAGEALSLPMIPGVSGMELPYHSPSVIQRFKECSPDNLEPISNYYKVPYGGLAPRLTPRGRYIHPLHARILTPRECARLQTLPDDYCLHKSKVEAYRQIADAVPPVMSQYIGDALAVAWNPRRCEGLQPRA